MYGFSRSDWEQLCEKTQKILMEIARKRQMISYSDLAIKLGDPKIRADSPALASLLEYASRKSVDDIEAMISVVVVHKTGDMEPGKGFYSLADELGLDTEDQQKFWIDQLHAIHKAYLNS